MVEEDSSYSDSLISRIRSRADHSHNALVNLILSRFAHEAWEICNATSTCVRFSERSYPRDSCSWFPDCGVWCYWLVEGTSLPPRNFAIRTRLRVCLCAFSGTNFQGAKSFGWKLRPPGNNFPDISKRCLANMQKEIPVYLVSVRKNRNFAKFSVSSGKPPPYWSSPCVSDVRETLSLLGAQNARLQLLRRFLTSPSCCLERPHSAASYGDLTAKLIHSGILFSSHH